MFVFIGFSVTFILTRIDKRNDVNGVEVVAETSISENQGNAENNQTSTDPQNLPTIKIN